MLKGSIVALITPFKNNQIDEDALRQLVEWHIQQGTNGLVPMGTTGESSTVSFDEHKRVVEIVVEQTQKRIPVIAGAGSNNPTEALEFAQHAQDIGADALLCVAGYYNRPSQEGLFQHFHFLHENTQLPIIIYNIPPRAVVDILPETMARLSALDRVIGLKDATGDLARISLERQQINKTFSYLSGEDMTALAYNAMGGNGCISVTANIAPKLCREFQDACLSGDYNTALTLHERLVPLHRALFREPSPAGAKYGAALLGLCQDEVRLPILSVSDETKKMIQQAMMQLDLLNEI